MIGGKKVNSSLDFIFAELPDKRTIDIVSQSADPYQRLGISGTTSVFSMRADKLVASPRNLRNQLFDILDDFFLDLGVGASVSRADSTNFGKQRTGLKKTIKSFIAVGADVLDCVHLGCYQTGLSVNGVNRTIFHADSKPCGTAVRSVFRGSIELMWPERKFRVADMVWASPILAHDPDVKADTNGDSSLYVTKQLFETHLIDRNQLTSRPLRVRISPRTIPIDEYGQRELFPSSAKFSLPLVSQNGVPMVETKEDSSTNTVMLDRNGVFNGFVINTMIFHRSMLTQMQHRSGQRKLPSTSLVIQINRQGLVCSVDIHSDYFGLLGGDFASLRQLFHQGAG